MEKILEVKDLKKYFVIERKGFLFDRHSVYLKAVDRVSFDLFKGETLGLVGESGCGKSTLSRTIMRLHDATEGQIILEGKDITHVRGMELNMIRKDFQMIFQDPYASLNPRMTVGNIIAEPLHVFAQQGLIDFDKSQIVARVKELLDIVGLNPHHINRYPHEFSGGQRQRIGIARALALKPKLIICDEPVSALDVSIQAQIINLLQDLQNEFDLTYLFIAHDLSVVRHISTRVAVMYLGQIVEIADYYHIYDNAMHPYSQALLSAVPIPDPVKEKERQRIIIKGDVKRLEEDYQGCPFYDRCSKRMDKCQTNEPQLKTLSDDKNHQVACFLYD